MGVLANTKQMMKTKASDEGKKVADGIATAAVLSPKQLEKVKKKREEYLAQAPDMNSEEVQAAIERNLGAVGVEVYQAYLEQLKTIYQPVDMDIESFDELNRIRYFDITKWVVDSEENNLDRLVNVYQVLSEENCNIALLYHRTKEKCCVTLGVVNTDEERSDAAKIDNYCARLENALRGNFPGVELITKSNKEKFGEGIPENLKQVMLEKDGKHEPKSVAVVSNVASDKSEDFISQSMEKLLDGVVPQKEEEEYTIVLLANPVVNQLEKKTRLFEMYSALAPYASWQTNYTITDSMADGAGTTGGVNLGVGITVGNPKVASASANFGTSFSRASNVTVQLGKNEGITQNYTNYGVKHTLELLENQLKRLEQSAALGMWEFVAYVISKDPVITNNVAHMYLALTQGEESYMTKASVNLWDGVEEQEEAVALLKSIQKLQHPVFGLKDSLEKSWYQYPLLVTPSADISGKELAKALNFPRKSVSGLPVLESVSFGREVQTYVDAWDREECGEGKEVKEERKITIGSIYHMRRKESTKVSLDADALCSHVFVTGSTGTGKSNAIYQLLDKLRSIPEVKFLVVEPAKGEYKRVLKNCKVYGTNSAKAELLRLNPFSFPEDIHVLEHIDRLVEIFNACWPMYAAMPAVLKDAVEKSYEKVGWNLRYSKCEPKRFPTFSDLMEMLPEVMQESMYSADTRSDYEGALLTRVRSLTNGLNGQIFCTGRELSEEELFEQNVIVDLNRVASNETRALLMGLLVMKLQEYRLCSEEMNGRLRHVTVLEEAHNLLRKTFISQSQEGANLQGKSVEMLTNAIAEMRTYGEGFIIADQAPELLDEAVIRNTNTKIVLRLPNEADRVLAGTSMALNENQIKELAKLPKGVAAVYQNDWLEAVLCKFEKYESNVEWKYAPKNTEDMFEVYFKRAFGLVEDVELKQEQVDELQEWIRSLRKSERTRDLLQSVLKGSPLGEREKELVAYNVFEGKKLAEILAKSKDAPDGISQVNARIRSFFGLQDNELIDSIRKLILQVILRSTGEGELSKKYAGIEGLGRLM